MLTRTSTMSSYEDDDLDDELPCVSLSQSMGGKSELEMPPASQIASLRAREDAAERALQDLHENNDPLLISLSRSTSQSSTSEEGEAALSAAVSALQVTETQHGTRGLKVDRLQLLTAIQEQFPEDKFLDGYIQMLKDKPEAVDSVTEHILQGISSALISGRSPAVPPAAAWLLCVALSTPRALRVRRALHAILDSHANDAHVRTLAVAVSAAIQDAEQLLAAYDAVRTGARRGADRLASVLLAHAMSRVLAQKESLPFNPSPPTPLSSETVSLVRSSWRKLPTRSQLTLLRCAGRALAAVEETRDMGDMADKGVVGDMGDVADKGVVGDKGDVGDIGDTSLEVGEKMDVEVASTVDAADSNYQDSRRTKSTECKDIDGMEHTDDTDTSVIERGGALLAALAQPLARSSAFDINRHQVLTNVSKLQLLFRERFIRGQEKSEDCLNCSQNSVDESAEATPTKSTVEMKIKIPIKMVTPMKLSYPIVTQNSKDQVIKQNVKGQLKLDLFFKQGTQVKVAKDEGERSPEPKRLKRRSERLCRRNIENS